MKILYWNVCSAVPPETIIQQAGDLIDTEKIDVACLQEMPYKNSLPIAPILARELEMSWWFDPTRILRKNAQETKAYGTAVLSSLGIEKLTTKVLRDDKWAYMTQNDENCRSLVSFRAEERPDIMINVAHLSYGLPFGIGKSGRDREAGMLRRELSKQTEEYDVIFGGDINAQPLSRVDRELGSIGLVGIVDNSIATFRSRHWFAGHIERNLDRVFVSPDLYASAIIGERRQSDHKPIIVTVS